MEREYYIVEVEGEGCYCLCYDDVDGNRVVVDRDLEIREDWYYGNDSGADDKWDERQSQEEWGLW